MNELENLSKGDEIKADLYSRPNAMNGKYRIGQLGLDNLAVIKSSDVFYLETLEIIADIADEMISKAEAEGKDTNDVGVLKEIREEINITPIHRSEGVVAGIFASLYFVVAYSVAAGIWGIVFNNGFLAASFYGLILGLLLSLLFILPKAAAKRSKESIRDLMLIISHIYIGLAVFISVAGLIVLAISAI